MTLYDLFNHDILDESKAYVYIFKDNVFYAAGYYKNLSRLYDNEIFQEIYINYIDNIVICRTYSKFLERSWYNAKFIVGFRSYHWHPKRS